MLPFFVLLCMPSINQVSNLLQVLSFLPFTSLFPPPYRRVTVRLSHRFFPSFFFSFVTVLPTELRILRLCPSIRRARASGAGRSTTMGQAFLSNPVPGADFICLGFLRPLLIWESGLRTRPPSLPPCPEFPASSVPVSG